MSSVTLTAIDGLDPRLLNRSLMNHRPAKRIASITIRDPESFNGENYRKEPWSSASPAWKGWRILMGTFLSKDA